MGLKLTFLRNLSIFLASLCACAATAQEANHNFEVAKQLDIFNSLYRNLDLYYVDTLSARTNVENAINYMLSKIDLYTEYYPEDETSELRQLTTGKYAGIGAVISYKESEDRCIIAEPYEGMPAATAGLLPGDVILSVAGEDIAPCGRTPKADYSASVSEKLRGEPGTSFEIKIKRPSSGKVLNLVLTRKTIALPSIALAKILSDSIGYIRLEQFTEGSAEELRRAVVDLKQQGAARLILDLRGNPGGLLDEAVKAAALFLPRGKEVVRTKGKIKEANHTYLTAENPLDAEMPLVVLIDFSSASAAEILSGALQDYDRAVLIGQRTYGKGLVQQSRELPHNGVLKLTSGKYYIPSGRCVQAYEFKDGLPVHLPDSLAKAFFTAAGRKVYDSGGITPDLITPVDSLPRLLDYLEASDQVFDYCVEYQSAHKKIAPAESFCLTDEEYREFLTYIKEHNFTYDRQSLKWLESLRDVARIEGYEDEAEEEFNALEQKLRRDEDYDFLRWEKEIRIIVESQIVNFFYYRKGLEEYLLRFDNEIDKALDVVRDDEQMHAILRPQE